MHAARRNAAPTSLVCSSISALATRRILLAVVSTGVGWQMVGSNVVHPESRGNLKAPHVLQAGPDRLSPPMHLR